MKYLSIIGVTAALVCYADLAVAKTPAEIESIARAVTVEIRLLRNESVGSGIIIDRQGDLYTLITNRHVVCGQIRKCTTPPPEETYTLKLGDRQEYRVAAKSVKILGSNLDLALVQFRSNRAHPVAQVDDSGSLKMGDIVYTSGYPAASPGFSFNIGSAIAVVDKRLTEDRGGYTVVYDALTQPGMSGGGVFSQEGLLVAIHGQGERFRENTELETLSSLGIVRISEEVGSKIGYNRGIPLRWVVRGLAERGIKLGNRQPVNLGQTVANSADEHFIAGFNQLVEPGADVVAGKRLAISKFSQAIRINPSYKFAYFMRAITYNQLQEYRRAVADFDRAITLDSRLAIAYYNRGTLKADKLNDFQGALADFDRAIILNPKYVGAYSNRGTLKANKLNDSQGALADFDRAIILNPKYVGAYSNRGTLKADKLNDSQGALADFDRAITLDPQDTKTYYNRGILKTDRLNDRQGALADFDRAIALSPKFANAYGVRGYLKQYQLNDHQGALSDYDRAIALSPKFAKAYYNRGFLKADKLNDTQGALADYDRTIALDPKYIEAYYNRGNLKKDKLNDPQGALADYDRVIALDPKFANAYGVRGYLKYIKLGSRSDGITDMRQAAKLARAQGNSRLLQLAIETLQSWGVRE
jgi:tetratricopeptide (TPR) repeat protein